MSCGYKKCFPSLRHHSAAPARQGPRCICALCAIARAANVCQILFLPLSFTLAEKACAGCACWGIVADLYSGQMLSAVTDMSYGILAIVPKYADGTPITDFEDVIITENGRELKAWDSIARYMASFADTDGDGIANVPAYYSTTHGRKLVDTSRTPLALLKNPNKFTAVYAGLLAVAVLLIVLVVLLIRKLVKKARHRTA